ncbi:hypothetical protein FDECE_12283 [Fusarium decemcellulare]|nr:hypothetical protein FDECE_12283 [Fusarium decemcellulare]
MDFENNHQGCDMGASKTELTDLVTTEDIRKQYPDLAEKLEIDPGKSSKDSQLLLGAKVADQIVQALSKINSRSDISIGISKRTGTNLSAMSPAEKSVLVKALLKHANVEYDSFLDPNENSLAPEDAANDHSLSAVKAGHLQVIAQGECHEVLRTYQGEEIKAEPDSDDEDNTMMGGREVDGDAGADDDCDMTGFNQARQLMDALSADETDLEDICGKIGIGDWKDLRVPGMVATAPPAKPHQVIGAWWIYQHLKSPLRAAILGDECGIGKTLQIGMALAIHCSLERKAHEEGTRKVIAGQRHFKPSIIFCPAAVVCQIFKEFSKWFGRFFKIRVAYGIKSTSPDPSMTPFILASYGGIQGWIDQCAAKHEEPETLCHILLVPYTTAVRRMVTRKKPQVVDQSDLPQVVQEEEDDIDPEPSSSRKYKKRGPKGGKVLNKGVYLNISNAQFNWVICDEGHLIKNPNSVSHKLVKMLPREALLIVSATPLLNHLNDIWAYINLMWRQAWPFKYSKASAVGPQTFYNKQAWETIKKGETWEGLTMDRCLGNDTAEDSDEGADSAYALQLKKEYIAFVGDGQGPLFLLNPQLFEAFKGMMKNNANVAQIAIKPLLEMLCLRRGMLSELTLPDGSIVSPGGDIPDMKVRTVELAPHEADLDVIQGLIRQHFDKLLINNVSKYPSHMGHGVVEPQTRLFIDNNVLRTLALLTTHLKFYALTQANFRNVKLLDGLAAREVVRGRPTKNTEATENDPVARNLLGKIDSDAHRMADYYGRRLLSIPGAGVDEINSVVLNDRSGGLQWFFYHTRPDGSVPFPTARVHMAQMLCFGSPKLSWTVQRVIELNDQGERVLIYVNHPLTSMILNGLFTCLGVRSLHVRSAHSAHERAKAVRHFNDPKTDVGVLITSLQLGAFGVNYHGACHHGIILEYPHNLPTVMHAVGRLWRLGQNKVVEWDIVYLRHAFDAHLDSRMAQKYAPILVAEGQISPEIEGENRLICTYEIIRMYLGHESNRYPRARVSWDKMDHELVRREGHFYSAVARFLMKNPTHSSKISEANLEKIALS